MPRTTRLVNYSIGLAAALGGLTVNLFALPIARFGTPLFAYVPYDPFLQSVFVGAVVVWVLAAGVALVATLMPRAGFRGGPLFWVLLGFGPPSLASSALAAVIGLLTYGTGVVPDAGAEAPWQVISRGVSYAGAVAVIVCIIMVIAARSPHAARERRR
ncbi:MAG TPA: hypothetical protein VL294_12570 [Pseudolysinimonas sp.]|nr:hypothetical protein [Pseudolysinimonas sp.]